LRRAIGRGFGFFILAGLAMAIIAALVLMPAWAVAVRAEHATADALPKNEDAKHTIALRARSVNAIPYDHKLTERLARGTVKGDIFHTPEVKSVPKPTGWRLDLADKLAQTKTRRGLFLVACVALAGAMFLFSPPPLKQASRCRQET